MLSNDTCVQCGRYVVEGEGHLCWACRHELQERLIIPNFMSLKQFCERFVGHNSVIYLYNEYDKGKYDKRTNTTEYKLLWSGMDWQIVQGPGDDTYFEMHPEVHKCPYANCNVVKVKAMLDRADCAELAIFIELDKRLTREKVLEAEYCM